MSEHDTHMHRCLSLAQKGLGKVAPNPLVGCVIVHEGRIIGEGWHQAYGEPHAEVMAMRAFGGDTLPTGSSVYVNLEPCSHFGKTPPCADMLIRSGASRVFIGTSDPFPKVSGRGISKLKEAGIEMHTGIMEAECRQLNCRFFTSIEKKRPFIILKWVESNDGFVAPTTQVMGTSYRLSSADMDVITHRWRSENQAILVGSNTALKDDPSLSVRHVHGRQPLRILLDRSGKVPAAAELFHGKQETVVIGKCANPRVESIEVKDSDPLKSIIKLCNDRGIQGLYVEGGPTLHDLFFEQGLWDEVRRIRTSTDLTTGIPAPKAPHSAQWVTQELGNERIDFLYNG